ncbi:MAG: hypothetical protein M1834_006579 [Cirrosporium novae-zelandiae]|nr:MAG: hypothetical protein M1834_006579 [Cirrosporium novae-zelandiae]
MVTVAQHPSSALRGAWGPRVKAIGVIGVVAFGIYKSLNYELSHINDRFEARNRQLAKYEVKPEVLPKTA